MAYRVFEEVSDTRPMPTGFASGFNPIIPTEEQVKAVKQKQEQDKIKKTLEDPNLKFAENAKIDQEFFNENKGIIGQQFQRDIIEKGEVQPQTYAEFNRIQKLAGKSISDIQAQEDAIKTYGNNPAYKQGFAIYSSQYEGGVEQRPYGTEYYGAIGKEPEKIYDLSEGAKGFVDNLGTISTQIDTRVEVGGVNNERANAFKSKFKNGVVDNDAINAFYQADPVNKRSVNYNRELTDIAAVNTTKSKIGTRKKQNTDGTITTEVVTFNSPEELATAYSIGDAYPSDAKGVPLKGFESKFNKEERNNQVAKNYLLSASGYERSNERSTVVDENQAGVRSGFGFGFNTNKDISLIEATQSDVINDNGLSDRLLKAGVPQSQINFIKSRTSKVVVPQVIKDGNNEPIKIDAARIPMNKINFADSYIGEDKKSYILTDEKRDKKLKNIQVLNARPATLNSNDQQIIMPDDLTGQERINYLVERTGTNPRGEMHTGVILSVAIEDEEGNLQQREILVNGSNDQVFKQLVTTFTPPSQRKNIDKISKDFYQSVYNLNPDNEFIPTAKKIQFGKATPSKNTAPANTPTSKPKTPKLDVTQ